eukprot:SAG31_NODE_33870_length_339_cov_0.812500_1_plen_105_part_10
MHMESVFTELRKVANHPLLTRRKYTGELFEKVANYLHNAGAFGSEASKSQVIEEITGAFVCLGLPIHCDARLLEAQICDDTCARFCASGYSDFQISQLCEEYRGL